MAVRLLEHLSSGADPLLGEAALSAATKLSQVLPNNLRARIESLRDVVVGVHPRLHAPLDVASSHIGPTTGFFDPADAHDHHCIVTIGGDADWVARFLVSLPMPFDCSDSRTCAPRSAPSLTV